MGITDTILRPLVDIVGGQRRPRDTRHFFVFFLQLRSYSLAR